MTSVYEIFARIAEAKIRQSIENGELDNLEGKGKPVQLDNVAFVPVDQRMAYRLKKILGWYPRRLRCKKKFAYCANRFLKAVTYWKRKR